MDIFFELFPGCLFEPATWDGETKSKTEVENVEVCPSLNNLEGEPELGNKKNESEKDRDEDFFHRQFPLRLLA